MTKQTTRKRSAAGQRTGDVTGRVTTPSPQPIEAPSAPQQIPTGARRLPLALVAALAVAVIAVVVGALALARLGTGGELAETPAPVPAETGDWTQLDPWIERELLRQQNRAGSGEAVDPGAWTELDPWIERHLRRQGTSTASTETSGSHGWMELDPWIERHLPRQ